MSFHHPFGLTEKQLLFFKTNRFFPCENYLAGNQYLTGRQEIVSFDDGLFDLEGIIEFDVDNLEKDFQIMAVVINPEQNENYDIDNRFEFCGFDLCEDVISAITNCECGFDKAIDYLSLNKYGLIDEYDIATETQKRLIALYPEESHAACQLIKIYRYVSKK